MSAVQDAAFVEKETIGKFMGKVIVYYYGS